MDEGEIRKIALQVLGAIQNKVNRAGTPGVGSVMVRIAESVEELQDAGVLVLVDFLRDNPAAVTWVRGELVELVKKEGYSHEDALFFAKELIKKARSELDLWLTWMADCVKCGFVVGDEESRAALAEDFRVAAEMVGRMKQELQTLRAEVAELKSRPPGTRL